MNKRLLDDINQYNSPSQYNFPSHKVAQNQLGEYQCVIYDADRMRTKAEGNKVLLKGMICYKKKHPQQFVHRL